MRLPVKKAVFLDFILVDSLQKVGICALARKDKPVVFEKFKREVFDFHSSTIFVTNSDSCYELA